MSNNYNNLKNSILVLGLISSAAMIFTFVGSIVTKQDLTEANPFEFFSNIYPLELETSDGRKFIFRKSDVRCVDELTYYEPRQMLTKCTVKGYVQDLLGNKVYYFDGYDDGSGISCNGDPGNLYNRRLACLAAKNAGIIP